MSKTILYRGAVYREANTTLPTKALKVVWHVGTMDPESKGADSFEGSGLSVSVHPNAWRAIARLILPDFECRPLRITHGVAASLPEVVERWDALVEASELL